MSVLIHVISYSQEYFQRNRVETAGLTFSSVRITLGQIFIALTFIGQLPSRLDIDRYQLRNRFLETWISDSITLEVTWLAKRDRWIFCAKRQLGSGEFACSDILRRHTAHFIVLLLLNRYSILLVRVKQRITITSSSSGFTTCDYTDCYISVNILTTSTIVLLVSKYLKVSESSTHPLDGVSVGKRG